MEYLRLKKKRRKKVKNPNICYPLFCKRKCVAFQNILAQMLMFCKEDGCCK